ncbi:RNA polymerase Rpb1, domain 3 [Artemisia annua]|uniref:DNA-directed RNA polymerase n=1 Tax=Artemisia annua TaxID=35608 RepID=A0A2U1MBF6_ARTAN|nr:RNA polymerase Rpb1, domain 3 [Artemisia annua]
MIILFKEEIGLDAASKFLGYTQLLIYYWLLQQAFNIGIGDTIADASTMETINEAIFIAKNEVKELIRAALDNQSEAEPGRTIMESFENKVNQSNCLQYLIESGTSYTKKLEEELQKHDAFIERLYEDNEKLVER